MKNLLKYYILILFPIPILAWTAIQKHNILFLVLILTYFLYRCIIDYYRLLSIGIIEKKDFWKTLIPFWNLKYFKAMYLKC
jgi:hypothetical protein